MRNVLVFVLVTAACLFTACGDDSGPGDSPDLVPTPPTPQIPTPPTPPADGSAGSDAEPVAAGVPGCEIADTSGDTHALVADVLAVDSPCGFSSCHQGVGKAGLVLSGVADLAATMVGVTACEAPSLVLVDNSGGDAGLNNSWLWQKMVAPAMPGGELTPDASWGTPGTCGQSGVDSYGTRMPAGGSEAVLDDARLAPIRNWICAGAPGPI